jgi:hypothetical protein
MALSSLSFGIFLRQHPAELFEERDLEFETVFLQGGVTNEPSVCWVDLEPRADPARARSEGRR